MNKKNITFTSDKLLRQLNIKQNVTKHLKLKMRLLTRSWLKGSLKAFPEGGDDLMTSSIYSLDQLSKCTLCPNPPGSPLYYKI